MRDGIDGLRTGEGETHLWSGMHSGFTGVVDRGPIEIFTV